MLVTVFLEIKRVLLDPAFTQSISKLLEANPAARQSTLSPHLNFLDPNRPYCCFYRKINMKIKRQQVEQEMPKKEQKEKKEMREPGLEPGSHAWEACMLTATLFAPMM